MSLKSSPANAKTQLVDLGQFTLAFFSFFGAEIRPQSRKKQAPLSIELTPELSEHFGKPLLNLCFQQAELAPGQDLVAYGSRIFDRMLAYLDQRGALTVQKLPSRFTSSQELLHAVRPVNASIAGLRMQDQIQYLFVFNWRITYRADDKREEIYAVVMDESGARVAQTGEIGVGSNGGVNAVDIEALLADAEPVEVERNEEGQPLPPKLLPLTQLTRLAESARKYAIYHADVRCVDHEAEILPRLHKSLNRLTIYYQQQIEEVYDAHDPAGEKRQVLEIDLQRKIAEEVENHRLRVQVQLISYAALQVPVVVADITLSDGKHEAMIQVRRNRYNGALRRPICYACGQEAGGDQATAVIALDRNGHVICDDCIEQCATCQDILCTRCGVAACPVCGKQNCDTCSRACWACGERACVEHSSVCSVCGDEVCHACQAECACCGVRQCRSHLRVDHVSTSQALAELICAQCAVRCPGCQQFSAHTALCSASGQRFCLNCLVTCATCDKQVGSGFYQTLHDKTYCLDCLTECPTCATLTPAVLHCADCAAACCLTCGESCAVCQKPFCAQHAVHRKNCEHVLCAEHAVQCHVCQGEACPVCNEPCGICEFYYCAEHTATCRRCGCAYCQECVRLSGLCDTCAVIWREGTPVDLTTEPCATHAEVAALAPHYRWVRADNQHYTIYAGQSMLMNSAVVVIDRRKATDQVILARKMTAVDTIRGNLWR
ncbi:MAG: hypothetical protein NT075_01370 [Chloroflexi bacterium]|nr:hypothetical protein [Chloroflexota bacterium]